MLVWYNLEKKILKSFAWTYLHTIFFKNTSGNQRFFLPRPNLDKTYDNWTYIFFPFSNMPLTLNSGSSCFFSLKVDITISRRSIIQSQSWYNHIHVSKRSILITYHLQDKMYKSIHQNKRAWNDMNTCDTMQGESLSKITNTVKPV